jgi:hypothetical protein
MLKIDFIFVINVVVVVVILFLYYFIAFFLVVVIIWIERSNLWLIATFERMYSNPIIIE